MVLMRSCGLIIIGMGMLLGMGCSGPEITSTQTPARPATAAIASSVTPTTVPQETSTATPVAAATPTPTSTPEPTPSPSPSPTPGPELLWTRQFGTKGGDSAAGVAADSTGNVYVVGWVEGALPDQTFSGGDSDAFVRKYDSIGTELWTRQFGTAELDKANSVAVDSEGGAFVAGRTGDALPGQAGFGEADVFLRKTDGDGNELWTRQFGTSSDDEALGVAVGSDGGVYVVGYTDGELPDQSNLGGRDAFVRRYGGDGNELWTRQFGTSSDDEALGVAVGGGGNLYVVGYTDGELPNQRSSRERDAFIRSYDGEGNELWTLQFGTFTPDIANAVALDEEGNPYFAGGTERTIGAERFGKTDAFVRKFDSDANVVWSRQFGSRGEDTALGATMSIGGELYIGGFMLNDGGPGILDPPNVDGFVFSYDIDGRQLWTYSVSTSSYDIANGLTADSEGNLYVVGLTFGTLLDQTRLGGQDAFLIKLSAPFIPPHEH